jgi:hypothetical protein
LNTHTSGNIYTINCDILREENKRIKNKNKKQNKNKNKKHKNKTKNTKIQKHKNKQKNNKHNKQINTFIVVLSSIGKGGLILKHSFTIP